MLRIPRCFFPKSESMRYKSWRASDSGTSITRSMMHFARGSPPGLKKRAIVRRGSGSILCGSRLTVMLMRPRVAISQFSKVPPAPAYHAGASDRSSCSGSLAATVARRAASIYSEGSGTLDLASRRARHWLSATRASGIEGAFAKMLDARLMLSKSEDNSLSLRITQCEAKKHRVHE